MKQVNLLLKVLLILMKYLQSKVRMVFTNTLFKKFKKFIETKVLILTTNTLKLLEDKCLKKLESKIMEIPHYLQVHLQIFMKLKKKMKRLLQKERDRQHIREYYLVLQKHLLQQIVSYLQLHSKKQQEY